MRLSYRAKKVRFSRFAQSGIEVVHVFNRFQKFMRLQLASLPFTMPSATASASAASPRIPSWKRLGLKLKSAQDSPDVPTTSDGRPQEIENPTKKRARGAEEETPSKKTKRNSSPNTSKSHRPIAGPLTPLLSHKKSVTFTPETKVEDGDSVKQLFNSWVAEQKSKDPDFLFKAPNQAFDTTEPSKVEEQIDTTLPESERRVKRVKKPQVEAAKPGDAKLKKSKQLKETTPTNTNRPFLVYLRQFCESRESWKFNKNHQNHLLKHAFNVEVVPSDHVHYLYQYVRTLQGRVRTRLRDTALEIKVEDQKIGAEGFPATMGDAAKRQREYEIAMKEQIATRVLANTSPNLGYEEGVLLGLSDSAMAPRMAKRMRSEQILTELSVSGEDSEEQTTTGTKTIIDDGESQKRLRLNDGSGQKVGRKRKQRTLAMEDSSSSSDSDSDSGSSSDNSSDDSESHESLAEGTSSSSSSSSSSSDSNSDSESGSGGDSENSDSESESESESEASD